MSGDTLERFILLPDLKISEAYPLGRWGIGINVEKTSAYEVCPKCAEPSASIYDHRTAKVQDEPIRGKAVMLKIYKRRFRCKNRRCKKVFTEPVAGISKTARTSQRFKKALAWAAGHYQSLKEVTKQFRCSARLVYTAFYEQLSRWAKAREHPLPKIIGLDEHSIRKPKYKATEFATIVVDHKGKKVFDLIDGKTLDDLRVGFAQTLGKDKVETVTIDMSETYRSFVKETFPNAEIVVDRFHVERLFVKKVNRARKKVTGDDRKNPINKLLLRPGRKLDVHERLAVIKWLNHHPELRELYEIKEAVNRMFRTKGERRAKRAFTNLLDRMGRSSLRTVTALRKTLVNWRSEILNFFKTRLSNGRVEGFNRVGKLIQRMGYGYRNFQHYRLRLLNACYFRD
jgi:transposase